MLERTLVVGAGGFLGSAARYLVQGLVYRYLPADFPYATFFINVTGCYAIGFLGVLAQEAFLVGPTARLFLMVGILGGYTTFSTFGYETVELLREGSNLLAAANAAGQVVLGLAAVWAGAATARGLL
jgi:fluoride exporter